MLPNGVCSSVTSEGALDGTLLRRVACIFHDVVFDKRVGSPTVDGEEAYSPGTLKRTREGDGTRATLSARIGE